MHKRANRRVPEEDHFVYAMDEEQKSVSVSALLRGGVTMSGYLDKLHYACGGVCWATWRRRFFVLKGRFLYKFTNESSSKPCGAPIPLDSARLTPSSEAPTLTISLIRKEYTLRSRTLAERDEWMEQLALAKHRAIKELMGHAPCSVQDKEANEIADELYSKALEKDYKKSREVELSLLSVKR